MKISPSIVFYLLSLEITMVIKQESQPGATIKVPFIFEASNAFKPTSKDGILYICNNVEHIKEHLRPLDALILAESEPCDIKVDCAYAFAPETLATEVLYRIFEIMQRLQSWDGSLKDARHQELPLDQVTLLINKTFRRPLLLIDSHYNYIVYTKSYFQDVEELKPEILENTSQEVIPGSVLNDLIFDKEFLSADKQRGVRFYPRDDPSGRSLYINFFQEDRYMARLLAHVGCDKVYQGEEELFAHASTYIKDIYYRHLDEQVILRQNDAFHANLKDLILNEAPSVSSEVLSVLESSSWFEKHEYQIAVIRMFNVREFELSALFLCTQLEDLRSDTAAFTLNNEIVWIINNSLLADSTNAGIEKVIKQILGDYACKAGISGRHSGLRHIRLLYCQALEAFRLGEAQNPHYWFYRFDDYKINYLVKQITTQYPLEHTIHSGIGKLAALDRQKGTDYLSYLKSYIESGLNTSHAADRIFVHRSTFIRQLARIKNLSGIDLSNDTSLEELTHIFISLELLTEP